MFGPEVRISMSEVRPSKLEHLLEVGGRARGGLRCAHPYIPVKGPQCPKPQGLGKVCLVLAEDPLAELSTPGAWCLLRIFGPR